MKYILQFRWFQFWHLLVITVSSPSDKQKLICEWSREGQTGGKHCMITISGVTKISELAGFFRCVTTEQYVRRGELCWASSVLSYLSAADTVSCSVTQLCAACSECVIQDCTLIPAWLKTNAGEGTGRKRKPFPNQATSWAIYICIWRTFVRFFCWHLSSLLYVRKHILIYSESYRNTV